MEGQTNRCTLIFEGEEYRPNGSDIGVTFRHDFTKHIPTLIPTGLSDYLVPGSRRTNSYDSYVGSSLAREELIINSISYFNKLIFGQVFDILRCLCFCGNMFNEQFSNLLKIIRRQFAAKISKSFF